MSALVVAFGNPLRRDDGVAHHVAARLEGRLPAATEIVCVQTPGPELAEAVARAERVVFVDASLERRLAAVPLEPRGDAPALFHTAGPEALLVLASALYGARPPAWIVAVPASDLGVGEGLSPACERLVAQAADLVAALASADPPGDYLPA